MNLPVHFYFGALADTLRTLLLDLAIQPNAGLRQSQPRPGPFPPRLGGRQSNRVTLVGRVVVPRLEGADG